ncbi:MAG: hypothetical protein WCP92_05915 [bacterium]
MVVFLLPVHIIAHDHLLKFHVPFRPVHLQKLPLHIIPDFPHDQKFLQENCVDLFVKVATVLVEGEKMSLYA